MVWVPTKRSLNTSAHIMSQYQSSSSYVHTQPVSMTQFFPSSCRSVGHVELERAKKAAISVICNALESKATSSEDIGRQFLTYGHRCAPWLPAGAETSRFLFLWMACGTSSINKSLIYLPALVQCRTGSVDPSTSI